MDDFDEGSRKVKVYLSSFGNIDAHNDIIAHGAFKKSIGERMARIKYLWQHNTWEPIGKWQELYEDGAGLVGVGILSNATKGQDAFEFYKEGIITEHSIGFDTIQQDYNSNTGIRTIKEVRLWEGSAVTWGANEQTPVIAMAKAANMEPMEYLKIREDKLIKFLRSSDASDEAHELVEMELKQITETYRTLLVEKAAAPSDTPAPEPFTIDLLNIYKTI